MITINIKPLSVNQAWQGRRFKTPAYKKFERDVLFMLPFFTIPDGEIMAVYEFGFSNKASDWDNPVKPIQDILQKKYGFDDNRIVEARVFKKIVSKGDEYFRFMFLPSEISA